MSAYREGTITAAGHRGEPGTSTPVVSLPSEIGDLLSCSADIGLDGPSEARRTSVGRARAGRIWFACLGGLAGGLFATLAWGAALGAAAGAVAAVACYALTGWLVRAPLTTFVGERGVARFRHGLESLEVLCFRDVKALRVSHAGSGTSIQFSYSFERDRGTPFRIVGAYPQTSAGAPDAYADHPVWFARAAEQAYVQSRLPGALAAIAAGDDVRFEVSKREAITLTAGGMELEPASGGVYRSAWRHVVLPRVNGEMIEFLAARVAARKANREEGNPFAAPPDDAETALVIFRGSELPDYALLIAIIEEKSREAHALPAATLLERAASVEHGLTSESPARR